MVSEPGSITHVHRAQVHPQRWRHCLDGAELSSAGGIAGITQDRRPGDARRDLFEQLQPFCADAIFGQGEAGGVAAWPMEARNEAGPDRIGDLHEHHRQRAGRLLHLNHDGGTHRQNDVGRKRDQFRRVSAQAVDIAACPPAKVDSQVTAHRPAQLLQS
jgi:hypothetical protein